MESRKRIEELYEGELKIYPGETDYYVVKLTDYLIRTLDDHCVQRLLREVENSDIALSLKLLGGGAREKLLENMSPRLAEMIVEDMYMMGPARLNDVCEAIGKMYAIIKKLMELGEIAHPMADTVLAFDEILYDGIDTKEDKKSAFEQYLDLEAMIREFQDSKNRLI